MSDAGADDAPPGSTSVDASNGALVQRMQARFEAVATADPARSDDDGKSVTYTLRITGVRDVQPMPARGTLPDAAGLVVADAESRQLANGADTAIRLRAIEILQGFEFDVASGRVTGQLLYDRALPARRVTSALSPRTETRALSPSLSAFSALSPQLSSAHSSPTWQWPALGLGTLAVVLTVLVWALRDAPRASIMAIVGLVVCFLVLQATKHRR